MEDNLKEALKYVVGLAAPITYQIGNETFSSDRLIRIEEKKEELVFALEVSTLTGFVEYIIINRDNIDLSKTLITISGTKTIELISVPNKDKNRETYIRAEAVTPQHSWGMWTDNEDFVIELLSKFEESEHREILMKYVGNMQEDQGVQTMDDGVSQKIVAKTGIANMSNVILPNPVVLRPYRTFQEIEQTESNFIFRVAKGGKCALFESDGGEWMIRCRRAIKKYLQEQLIDCEEVMIIS